MKISLKSKFNNKQKPGNRLLNFISAFYLFAQHVFCLTKKEELNSIFDPSTFTSFFIYEEPTASEDYFFLFLWKQEIGVFKNQRRGGSNITNEYTEVLRIPAEVQHFIRNEIIFFIVLKS